MAAGKRFIKDPQAPPKKRRKKATIATIDLIERKPDGDSIAGHEARLASFIKRTMELKRANYFHYEVAEMIAEEFKLESIPAIPTIASWYKQGMNAIREDFEEVAYQMRLEQFGQLEQMKRKWLGIALADHLEIRRWVMEEGSLQPKMDEDATKEQLEATKQTIAIMARQAKLLGLDLGQAINKEDGEGPQTLQALQLWIINQVSTPNEPFSGQVLGVENMLELKTGIPELDANSV